MLLVKKQVWARVPKEFPTKVGSSFILILGKNRRKKLDKSEYEWYYNKAV